jgi:hypothetical protein
VEGLPRCVERASVEFERLLREWDQRVR